MANTLLLGITETASDAESLTIGENSYSVSTTYTQRESGTISLAYSTTYTTLTLINLTAPTYLRLKTNNHILVKLDSESTGHSVYSDFIWTGAMSGSVSLNNATSGATALIDWDMAQ